MPAAFALGSAEKQLHIWMARPIVSNRGDAFRQRRGVDKSWGRSLPGTSPAAETPVRQFLCFQWFAPGFLESVRPPDAEEFGVGRFWWARKSVCAINTTRSSLLAGR